ncbi:MAG: 50S ribosomal protein L1 [Phycisphaeraceae bacterium]|nr:50S ribosomal protein L1 [Phycisphaeraceae bacterium]
MAKKLGKRYRADFEAVKQVETLPLPEAINTVINFKKTKFDQSVDICMHLGIDPKQADQMIRGSLSLPHGIGKTKRVIAFCGPENVEAAKEAGALEAGADELVKKIEDGWMDFDVAIASPDMMRVVSRLGRVLGPRGLMPSPKSGTVTPKVADAVKEYAAGKVEFRNDDGGNVHAIIGKQSFDAQKLVENAETFINQITKMKPSTTKGHYIHSITVSGTMTPGVQVEL